MRTRSLCKTNSISLRDRLSKSKVNYLARLHGYQRRKPQKISCYCLILSFFNCCSTGRFSLSNWAIHLGNIIGKTVSKQALFERINPQLQSVLMELIGGSLNERFSQKKTELLSRFSNVYIQDSSCLSLPESLRPWYSGNYSRGKIKSVAKLQVVFNLTRGVFSGLWLTPYSKNDQAASSDIIPLLTKGDLVVRDMGYFVLRVLSAIKQQKADFITRLKSDVVIYEPQTEKPLRLKKLLGKRMYLKKQVLLGKNERLPVWLIAIKVDNSLAGKRRNKLHRDRDKRKRVTVEKLQLAGWDIFVSSVGDLSPQEISEIYRLRWQIEIIFKSWKSHLKIEENISPNLKKPGLFCTMVYLSLLLVVLIVMPVYQAIISTLKTITSILKLTQIILQVLPQTKSKINFDMLKSLAYHASYECRNRSKMAYQIWKLA